MVGRTVSYEAMQNPPNFNLALEGAVYYGIVKRS
jgi:hypothetical protein